MEEIKGERSEWGAIKIANEVVGIIAGLAATEISGISAMSGGITGGITEALGMKNLAKGVKVEVGEKETAWQVQENVKRAIESMTGLSVVEVNVHVQGVKFPEQMEEEQPRVR